jgi:hypothetical protein
MRKTSIARTLTNVAVQQTSWTVGDEFDAQLPLFLIAPTSPLTFLSRYGADHGRSIARS